MPKISIVVPVYKAESFLHVCVNSILAQTYTNFELILVDDGSPDDSGALCDEFASSDDRIRVLHKKNGGVSSARNLGMSVASGEWLCFIDSDDFVDQTYLEDFLKLPKSDLLIQGYVTEKNNTRIALHQLQSQYESLTDIILDAEHKQVLNSPCVKLFSRKVVEDFYIRFDVNTSYGEDHLFTLAYLKHTTSVAVSTKMGYHQRILSSESLSQRIVPPKFLLYYVVKLKETTSCLFDFTKEKKLLAVYNNIVYNHLRLYIKNFFLLQTGYKQYLLEKNQFCKIIIDFYFGVPLLGKLFYILYTSTPAKFSFFVFSHLVKNRK